MEEQSRDKVLNIPVTDDEMDSVKRAAKNAGLSVSAFVRLVLKDSTDKTVTLRG